MALNFQGDRSVGVLNDPKNTFNTNDLFRVYDGGILVAGGVSVDHGDFVSWDGTKWEREDDIKIANSDEVSQQSSNIAEAFSASSTYAIGEVVIGPDGKLYQCTTAVSTAGEWDPKDWTQTSVAEAVGNVAEQTEQDMKDMEEMFLVNLPCAAKTFRFEFSKMDYDPTVEGVGQTGTWKKVNAKFHNVWDWTISGGSITDSFNSSFSSSDNDVEVIAAGDTSGISAMARVFRNCTSLKKVCLFNTSAATSLRACFSGCSSLKEVPNFDFSSATSLYEIFRDCSSLEKIPLFSTTSATDVTSMFNGCVKVKEGALDLYTQMSTQTTPPTTTTNCFKDCGKDTETGAAELAQIPESWGGTAAG